MVFIMARRNYKLERLQEGETFVTNEKGNSMAPLIKSGQAHKLAPATLEEVQVGDIVYCKVKGNFYTHLVKAKDDRRGVQISNNKGRINGWTKAVYGVVIEVIGGTHKRKKNKMKNKKLIYTGIPNYEVFFDQDGNLISMVHENDAQMRSEYHGGLFKHFGIELECRGISEKLSDEIYESEEKGVDIWDFEDKIKKELFT